MKKIWKKICLCLMVIISSVSLFACKKSNGPVSIDIDGDGVVSTWETLYENTDESERKINDKNVVNINSYAELKAINNDDSNVAKTYRLMKNINCNGEQIAINLGNSTLFGNNKYITNFKLGDIEDDVEETLVNGLFYNGVAIYDLRLFMGKQDYTLTHSGHTIISPLLNTINISNIEVKGWLNINRQIPENEKDNSMEISLGIGNLDILEMVSSDNNSLFNQDVQSVDNFSTFGKVTVTEALSASSSTNIGGVVSSSAKDAKLYNCNSDVAMNVQSSNIMNVGLVIGENNGFLSTCNSKGSIVASYNPCQYMEIGGVCGKNNSIAELKNCSTSAAISFDYTLGDLGTAKPDLNIGGIVGGNYGGVVDYATSDAEIAISNINTVRAGGICGVSNNGIFDSIISRGKITINKVKSIYAANMVGISRFGYMKSCIVDTPIIVNDQGTAVDNITIGALTIFEDLTIENEGSIVYNADYSPNFKGILLMGENIINVDGDSFTRISVNNGLFNSYAREIEAESPELGDVSSDTPSVLVQNIKPLIFEDVIIVSKDNEGKTYRKYKNTVVAGDESEELPQTPSKFVTLQNITSNAFINICVSDLDFKYGAGFNEIDLTSKKVSLIKFTLSEEKSKTGYFTKLTKNNSYVEFDKLFSGEASLDENSEMVSYLIYLIKKGYDTTTPLVFTKEYLESIYRLDLELGYDIPSDDIPSDDVVEDDVTPSDVEGGGIVTINDLKEFMVQYISTLLKSYIANPETADDDVKPVIELNGYREIIDESHEGIARYLMYKITINGQIFVFEFDIRHLMVDGDSTENYIFYLSFY